MAFWNFGDSTVEVYHGLKFVASLGPNKKHGMYSHEGDSFDFRLPPTGDDSPKPFAVWRVTNHHSQQVITEGSATDGLSLGAIVCYNTDPRYEEYRMLAFGRVTDGLLVEGKAVTIQAICERGNLQQFADSSRQHKTKEADTTTLAQGVDDELVQVYKQIAQPRGSKLPQIEKTSSARIGDAPARRYAQRDHQQAGQQPGYYCKLCQANFHSTVCPVAHPNFAYCKQRTTALLARLGQLLHHHRVSKADAG